METESNELLYNSDMLSIPLQGSLTASTFKVLKQIETVKSLRVGANTLFISLLS